MTDDIEKIKRFAGLVEHSNNIVFFGGAGVSTESGIKDFRSVDGLYNQNYDYPPETILSHSFFYDNTKEFYRFYRDKILVKGVKPNVTHYALAALEAKGSLKGVITQNIDTLHEEAGSKNVLHLHGSVCKNYCIRCKKEYPVSIIEQSSGIPRCSCGGVIKPDVVLYEEGLDTCLFERAITLIEQADVLIVGGTSLVVYPAAGLIDYYSKDKLLLVNKQATAFDYRANLVINKGLGEVFSSLSIK